MVNKGYDGKIDQTTVDGVQTGSGGTNPIFGVDGSPVVHDVLIEGWDPTGAEQGKAWRTILFVPYGRGGAGFSVLDVTHPLVKSNKGPIHMFSIFNDQIN